MMTQAMKDYVIDMMDALPVRDRNLILRTIGLAIRAWDPEYIKCTPREEKEIEEGLEEIRRGEVYTCEEVFGYTEEEALAATKGLTRKKDRLKALEELMARKKAEKAAASAKPKRSRKKASAKPAVAKRKKRTAVAATSNAGTEPSALPIAAQPAQ